MKKRILSFILTINILFLCLCGRLYYISSAPRAASSQPSTRIKEISSTRGIIYDCNLKPLVNGTYTYTFCVKPTLKSIEILTKSGVDENNINKLKKGNFLFLQSNNKDYLPQSNDLKALTVYERYTDNVALHIIGYTDSEENGVCGIEKYYNDELLNSGGKLSVAYSADANGRMLSGEAVEIRNESYYDSDGIVLTIDKDIQIIAENALKNADIQKGAAVVLDTATSAILACACVPCYNRNNLAEYIDDEDSPFLNRAFCAYPVGSVFKLVTAAAALENGVKLPTYNCSGSTIKSGNVFNCNNTDGHGKMTLETATANSCNPYFIELGVMTGAKNLLFTADVAGFGKSTDLGNGNFTQSGVLPDSDDLNSDAAVGNFAFGQGKLTATPLQIAAFCNTIANRGVYNEPYLIKGFSDEKGAFSPEIKNDGIKILNESTCKTLKDAMLQTTETGTGKIAFTSLFDSCTKTATAQSGQYNKKGEEIKYCWFTGFFPYEKPEYTICIIKEDGVSGGADCGPVFKEISENIYIKSKTLP
ncbi:MAG: penicillin-binding protein 2 [Clostridia bacterium]|nr:penicillin-binding protein 2 [Clostridia bacterium]